VGRRPGRAQGQDHPPGAHGLHRPVRRAGGAVGAGIGAAGDGTRGRAGRRRGGGTARASRTGDGGTDGGGMKATKCREVNMRTILHLAAVGLALVPAVVRGDEIHDAVRAGDVAKVKKLLAADPDLVNATVSQPSTWNWTPLHFAADEGNDDMVEL